MRYTHYFILLCLVVAGCNSNEDLPGAPPVANAGNSLDIPICYGTVTLDGSGSSDPDGDSLSYTWTLVDAPVGSARPNVNGSDRPTASMTPDAVGQYVVRLSVSDGVHPAVTDDVSIMVGTSTNEAPVANPGNDRTVPVGQVVTLDGSASTDVDNDTLTYQWGITGNPIGSQAKISGADKVQAQFTPDKSGRYVVALRVADSKGNCSKDNSAELVLTAQ